MNLKRSDSSCHAFPQSPAPHTPIPTRTPYLAETRTAVTPRQSLRAALLRRGHGRRLGRLGGSLLLRLGLGLRGEATHPERIEQPQPQRPRQQLPLTHQFEAPRVDDLAAARAVEAAADAGQQRAPA
eukprot:4592938-Prymnesium_polylepis.1